MSDLSSILTLFSGLAGVGDPVLNALYGGPASGGDPIQALQTAERNESQDVAATAAQPAVARDISAFQSAVANAKTPAELLANPAFLKVLLTASGMSDQLGFTALATQALLSNPADPKALVNQLSDTRWKTVNETYNFATQGLAVIQNPKVLSDLANSYAEQVWRQSLDATTPGLSNALTFRSQAASITSVDQILGDPVLRSVVTTALGIPIQIALQDLHAQEQAITSRLDISRFQDPKFVESFTDQYLLAMQQQQGASQSGSNLTGLAVQAAGLVV
jgi:hypothetical protein